MQVIEKDPLDKHINIDRATIEKNPYYNKITFEEKVNIALDALFDDSKMSKRDFSDLVNRTLIREPLISEHFKNLFLEMRTFRGSIGVIPRITELFEVPISL